MKTPAFIMKNGPFIFGAALLLLVALVWSCKKSATTEADAGKGSATLKLTQSGQVITTFTTAKASGLGGDSYEVIIASTDDKHTLSLSIIGQSPGSYPFITPTQALTNGKANYLYQSYDLPAVYVGTVGVLTPDNGSVTLTTATKSRCSGTFTSSGKNVKDGKTYTLEGTFDLPIQ